MMVQAALSNLSERDIGLNHSLIAKDREGREFYGV